MDLKHKKIEGFHYKKVFFHKNHKKVQVLLKIHKKLKNLQNRNTKH